MVGNKVKNITLILFDEPYQSDQRVLSSIQKYKTAILVDCNYICIKEKKVLQAFQVIFNLILSFFYSFFYWKKLYKEYNLKPKGFFSGLKKSIQTDIQSKRIAKEIIKKYKDSSIKTVYANDLFCGLIGKEIANSLNINFIYDAHEVEFHRNRKNGLLRVVYDILLEKKVIKKADKVIVVNKPIKNLYMDIYGIVEDKIEIVDNNHFSPCLGYALNMFTSEQKDSAIVYVGGGILGRKLESLAQESTKTDIKVYGFFLANTPETAYKNNWVLGSKDYLPKLLELVQQKHLVMWSCTEDICLSYRLSLPNKFFQAIAIGIPIIAYKDTYLAEIVQKYNLGYIYDDKNFGIIVSQMQDTKQYYALLKSINLFQKKLFQEGLEL